MRETLNFNDGWLFSKLPIDSDLYNAKVEEPSFDDGSWENVSLPHTYNAKDGASGRTGICEGGENYYRGLVCYRKRFEFERNGKKVFLEFGAANTVANVYLNGRFVGTHEGGFSSFRFDVTEFLQNGDNLLSVKVSNAPTDYIAPITDQGDFTKMGGLYRGVKFIVTDEIHIDLLDFGSSGVYVTPKNVTESNADADVLVKLANDSDSDKNITLSAKISDSSGNLVATVSKDVTISSHSKGEATLNTSILSPRLWNGRKDPHLYKAEIFLSDGDSLLDSTALNFGIRSFAVDKDNGFFINGKYLDLHGVNYHQDSYENGWAMTDEQRERDYKMMLDLGCTAVRMAHYQHCENEYDLCDRFGLIVWTEIGIVNKISPDNATLKIDERFKENAKAQIKELIRQNYNHPSIAMWGISNELYQMNDEIYSMWSELSQLVTEEDETRLKVFADNQFYGRFLNMPVDIVGYNRYFGWYKDAGPAKKFGEWLDLYHDERAKHPICVSEYGGGAAISQHKENIDWENEIDPWGERHYENYQSDMHEKIWTQFNERKYLWGKFVWCMFDFASDGREEGDTKGLNDKGLCTRERIPKDSYFFYRSVWNEEPMVHIVNKRFSPRPSVAKIKVYSNAEKLELFVNGISKGCCDEMTSPTVFVWNDIVLKKGKNTVSALAYLPDGRAIEDVSEWLTE